MTPQVYDRAVLISTPGDDLSRLAAALDFASNLGYGRPTVVAMSPHVYHAVVEHHLYHALRDGWPALVADSTLAPLLFAFSSPVRAHHEPRVPVE